MFSKWLLLATKYLIDILMVIMEFRPIRFEENIYYQQVNGNRQAEESA